MSLPRDLLEQAQHLVRREPKKPRQASLRRAVSAAYYALFHLLIEEATRRLLRGKDARPLRPILARAFDHGTMKTVAVAYKGEGWRVPSKLGPGRAALRVSPGLRFVAETFVQLQAARHEADYNTAAGLTRNEAKDLVEQATKAFAAWDAVPESEAIAFLLGCLAWKGLR